MSSLSKKEMLFIEHLSATHLKENNQSFVSVSFEHFSGLTVQECYDIGNRLKELGLIKFSPTLGGTAHMMLTYRGHEIIDANDAIKFRNKQSKEIYSGSNNISPTSETAYLLGTYPNALKPYNEALKKLDEKRDARNLADDLRLSLENLLRNLLSNKVSLENNIKPTLEKLDEKKVSVEIRNLFQKVLIFYKDYQNNKIKHACDIGAIDDIEIGYLFEQTNIIIKFLIQVLGVS